MTDFLQEQQLLADEVQLVLYEPETNQLMDSLWLEVKTDGNVDNGPIIGICITILLVGGYLITRSVRTRRRKARRCAKWKNQ